MLETKRRRRSESQQRLAPNSQYAKPKSKPAREAFLFAAFPASRSPCCTIPAVILKMGARGVTNMAARLWQRCRQTKFINAQHSKLTCSARYAPLPSLSFPSLTLLSASSPAGLCCCSKVKVCLKAVNNLTTKYESVKWPEEGSVWGGVGTWAGNSD